MFKIILFLFVAVPLLELYVLIEVGSGLGGFFTIILCLLTAAIGGWLIRLQGLKTLLSAQQELTQGTLTAERGLHGILLAIAGLLLFLPGFITDSIGFLLLVPALQKIFFRKLLKQPQASNSQIIDAEIIDVEIIDRPQKIKH
ncbi:MAG: FxsA family protein [Mariprofundaceae bacterium]